MQHLKQSTQVDVRVGPFVDATDGVTPETGVTLGAADQAEALKHDGAATVDISGATWVAVTGCDGWYDLTLTTSHTDTLGLFEVVVQDSSVCLPVFARFMITPANVWDSLYGADLLTVDVTQILGQAQAGSNLSAAALGMHIGIVSTSSTTTSVTSNLTGFGDDTFNGRVMTFYATGDANFGETVSISDYVSSTGTFTVSALTTAPSNTDVFIIT